MRGSHRWKLGLAIALLGCTSVDAFAQRWEYIGETPTGEWSIDAASVSVVADAVVHAWIQLKVHKEVEGPNGVPFKYMRMMSRFHCTERWSLSLVSDVRTAGESSIDTKTFPPDPSRRSYPAPNSMSMEILQAACQFWKKS